MATRRIRTAIAFSAAAMAAALLAPVSAAALSGGPAQGDVWPASSSGISVTMTITPTDVTFPDSATIDMVATYGYRSWQPYRAASCAGATPFAGVTVGRPVAAWCVNTPWEWPGSGRWVPKGVATFTDGGRQYLALVEDDYRDRSGYGYAQLTLTRKPSGGQPARVADVALNLPNGAPIPNHGGGIAVVGTKLYLADGRNLRVFDLTRIGANRDSYGLVQTRVYTSTQNLFTSLSYDKSRNALVATAYTTDPTTDHPITFWSLASNGYLKAHSATIRPLRTWSTRTTEVKGLWVDGSTFVLATSQTSTGRLYVENATNRSTARGYAWVDEPAGLAEWSDGFLVSSTQPFWSSPSHSSLTEETVFVLAKPRR